MGEISVSVLMTAYNREKYIQEAIESVLASSLPDFELIIVDDRSTDSTVSIAKSFEAKDKRVKVFVNEVNLGDYANRNRAASYATGEFIMFVDSDDTIFPDGLEKCSRAMLSFPGANFGLCLPNEPGVPFSLFPEEALRKHFFETPFLIVGPGGTIIRRSFFIEMKGYPEKYGPANDMYFNLKASCHSNIILLPFEFMFYRRHDGQEINNKYSYLYNSYLYLRDAIRELGLPLKAAEVRWLERKNKRRLFVNLVSFFLKTGDVSKTRKAIQITNFSFANALQAVFHL